MKIVTSVLTIFFLFVIFDSINAGDEKLKKQKSFNSMNYQDHLAEHRRLRLTKDENGKVRLIDDESSKEQAAKHSEAARKISRSDVFKKSKAIQYERIYGRKNRGSLTIPDISSSSQTPIIDPSRISLRKLQEIESKDKQAQTNKQES